MMQDRCIYETLLDEVSLAAGEERGGFIAANGFENINIMAYGEAQYDVYSYPSPDASYLMAAETLATAVTASSGVNKKPEQLAPYLYITIKNTGGVAAKFNLWAYAL
jgi:hypothetical protein